MHRSAPALFPCFDRALIFIRASLSAKITAGALGVLEELHAEKWRERRSCVSDAWCWEAALWGCPDFGFCGGGGDGSPPEAMRVSAWGSPGLELELGLVA